MKMKMKMQAWGDEIGSSESETETGSEDESYADSLIDGKMLSLFTFLCLISIVFNRGRQNLFNGGMAKDRRRTEKNSWSCIGSE
jgi:hypothetical protein